MLARPKDVVTCALPALHTALDVTRPPQSDADLRHDEPDGAAGAGQRGDQWVGPAVLRRDHEAVRRQVPQRDLGRPGRVIGLDGHEGDLEVTGQAGRLVEMDGGGMGGERLVGSGNGQPFGADGLDLLRPGINQRHLVPGLRQERPEVAADGPGAHEEEALRRDRLPPQGRRTRTGAS